MNPIIRKPGPTRLPPFAGFTLAELIVVITVLAILATVGFVALSGYATDGRDATRTANLSLLQKWAELAIIRDGSYPMPDDSVQITASGRIVSFQWVVRWSAAKGLGVSQKTATDPADTSLPMTYSVSGERDLYQFTAYLESGRSSSVDTAYAAATNLAQRPILQNGSPIGALYDSASSLPIQNLWAPVDVLKTNTGFVWRFGSNESFSGTWYALKSWLGWGGIVWYWDFDEPSGNTAFDRSWNNNGGTFSGTNMPVRGSGKFWWAVVMTNSGYVSVGKISALDMGDEGTFAAWFKTNKSYTWGYGQILVNGHGRYFGKRYGLSVIQNAQNCMADLDDDGPAWAITSKTETLCNDDAWHHVAGVKRAGTLEFYFDGVRTAKSKLPANFWEVNSEVGLTIGAAYNQKSNTNSSTGWAMEHFFSGSIDEVRIYSRPLAPSEISNLYQSMK